MAIVILLNSTYVQQKIAVTITERFTELTDAELNIGKISVGFLFNRLTIEDVLLKDKGGEEMLKVSRLSVKYSIWDALHGKISLNNVQLFGFDINLDRENLESEPNFMFLVDAFASKDMWGKSKMDLRINSLLVRRGRISYDVLSEEKTPGKFNSNHIKLRNIIGNISLKALKSDSLNAYIKRLSFEEQSGFELKKLSLRVLGNEHDAHIENLMVNLPNTSLQTDKIHFSYDSIASFERFADEVHFTFKTLPSSYFTLQDISPFIPALTNFKEKINIGINVDGTLNKLNGSSLQIDVDDFLKIRGTVFFKNLSSPTNAFIDGKLSEFIVHDKGIDFLYRNLSIGETPASLRRLQDISFQGEILGNFTDFVTHGDFNTTLGRIKTNLRLRSDKEKNRLLYSGSVQTDGFDIGKFSGNKLLGETAFNLDINGYHNGSQYPSVILRGSINNIEYSGYNYENIDLAGEYKYGGFNGKIELDDKNGKVLMNGKFNPVGKTPEFNFHADIKDVHPYALMLTSRHKDAEFSLKIDANFTESSINEIEGKIDIDSISFTGSEDTLFIEKFNLSASTMGETKKLVINSDFLRGKIEGSYSYQTLPTAFMDLLQGYIPALVPVMKKSIPAKNDFIFDLHIFNTKLLPVFFNIPLDIRSHSTIKGYFNYDTKQIQVEGHSPLFLYGDRKFESGMFFLGNPGDRLKGEVRFSNNRKDNKAINVSLVAQAKNDTIDTTINWGNSSEVTYSGKFSTSTGFSRLGEKSPLKTVIDIKETNIILNDTLWTVHPSQIIVADSGKIHINNFYFSHKDQYARVNGYASNNVNDTIKFDLKDLNIGYVFDAVNLKSLNFEGIATGQAYLNRTSEKLTMNSRLFVEGFRFNETLLGDMDIEGKWDEEEKGIYLDADIEDPDISKTKVTGYIYPLKPKNGVDLHIQGDNLDVHFLQYYLKSIVSNLTGRTTGKMRLFGPFNALDFEGDAKVNASMKVDILNTAFAFDDSVRVRPSEFQFNNIILYDAEGHSGVANGYVHHQNLKDISYRLNVNPINMLVMDLKEGADLPFYGTVYGTGNVLLSGDLRALNAEVALASTRNTNFTYITKVVSSAASNQFIKFIDRTPQRDTLTSDDYGYEKKKEIAEVGSNMDIRLNIIAEATPDATIRLIMDPVAGDFISGKGTGNLRVEYYNKGDVKIFGNYNINQGIYKFSLQEVIRKDFIISDGSSINFNDNLLNTTMNVQALYTVNSASLNDLIPENAELSKQPNVRVNCKMNLTGSLFSPNIKMDIELPNERDEIQTLVRNYLSTEEEMNMQILYLLGIGKFYMSDNTNRTQNSNLMSSVLSSTLSGQLNNMLSQIIDNNNWNIGTNLSTGDKGWTDVEVEGILSGQLLNNRLLINGNFGYRDSPLATTNFVGDFETELLLTRVGDIRLKAYNQTNDRYYIRSNNFTKQGLGIMFKKDFDLWNELLFWKRKKRKTNND
ncbi:hypothetical protein EZS27_013861 [termite gut metagenome]|uniref:Translocation and assembly module TamB C-terminal domain-containing protein n=1 Tax=termite gut metagenome TaxID=433724 RepID=A0A5J4RWY9_9ZZZZ